MDEEQKNILRAILETFLRIIFYAGIIAYLLKCRDHEPTWLSGAIVGLILADFFTWLAKALITLPGNVQHHAIAAVINIVIGVMVFKYCRIDLPKDSDALVMAYTSFFVVFTTKLLYYALVYFMRDEPEEEL